ncbi:Phenylalanine ammonia-lyase protein [Neofusicoccum parvum]|nr:Phenylalanine ammonia-lyase protein [Neofusicoccum parvum]
MGDHRIPADLAAVAAAVHARSTHASWSCLQADKLSGGSTIVLDGQSLTIAQLVAVAKHGSQPVLDKSPSIINRIDKSVEMLKRHLGRGDLVYGVNTGYGGSADVRTDDVYSLQQALVQHQQSGVLTINDTARSLLGPNQGALRQPEDFGSLSMPTSWVKGLMVSRVNSIIRGHSAVSLPVIEAIMAFLHHDITPIIPLRGSISASGDLQPLAYVAGALEGSPDIFVRVGGNPPVIMSASEALKSYNLRPIVLAAKEGLGLLNGTAASVSAASLAIYEANHLALLTQALTAMGVEALCGTAESFSPFIANVRPHRGQVEAAANIHGFLQGSRLASGLEAQGQKDMHISGLCQDRYPLRTSSQWIGPQLEDLLLANEQISVELNSTTDNPLIDAEADTIYHGGNFQAASLTSAMEKVRTSIQMLGKLLFAQGVELINSNLNRGLPPNLAADDPSLSFACKGIDINLAAYMSELGYLANPVSSHVQSAELHNQAVNSLALISARYTLQSIEVLSQMCAAYLFALCQALDLRVLQAEFLAEAYPLFTVAATAALDSAKDSAAADGPEELLNEVWNALKDTWNASTSMDLAPRAEKSARAAVLAFQYRVGCASTLVHELEAELAQMLQRTYAQLRDRMFAQHEVITPQYLGSAASKMYAFVRGELRVKFHRGLVDYPNYVVKAEEGAPKPSLPVEERRIIGSEVSVIYEALRAGLLHRPVMEALNQNGIF